MKIRLFLVRLFSSLLAGVSVNAFAETFAPRATGTAALVGEGVAWFLPDDLPPERVPPSFALLEPVHPQGELAASWSVRPVFSFSETRARATITIPAGTSLYGTGEVTGPLLRNGRTVPLWNTDNFRYEKKNGSVLYQSHPWVLAVRADGSAFGVIADTTWGAEISLESDIVISCDGPSFPVLVIERASPQAVVSELARLTGHMPLPPLWSLGYQQSRWSYNPDSRVRQIADEFRARKIPCDVLWMDIDYMDGFRVFTFSPQEFPDPQGLNTYLHDRGFHSVWMIDPGVKADPANATYAAGTAADVWVHDVFGAPYRGSCWPGEVRFPDYTRPETRAWWAALYKDFMATGIDGVWNDMNEPAVFDVPSGTMPLTNWHRGGGGIQPGPHARYHNVYGMLMVRASREGIMAANPAKRPFILTRSNYLGGQRYAATWTGDNVSSWSHLRMAAAMTMNLGLSGQPFNGPDLGGFSGNAEADLWAHWVAVGALFPFSRAHAQKDTNNKEPWAFGPEVENVARTALERRYRLLPYLYTLFQEASQNGLPVMRPVFFADPKNTALRAEDRAFLLGSDLLVVPKWAENPALPVGTWRSVSLVGEDSTADKYQPDLRLRAGAIVPLGRVIQNTTEKSLDPLTLLVCLDAEGRATGRLYEDAGDGYGYQQGDYLATTYTAVRTGDQVLVSIAQVEGQRLRPSRSVVVRVIGEHGVVEASGVDGQPVRLALPR